MDTNWLGSGLLWDVLLPPDPPGGKPDEGDRAYAVDDLGEAVLMAARRVPAARDDFRRLHSTADGRVPCYAVLPVEALVDAARDGKAVRAWQEIPPADRWAHAFVSAASAYAADDTAAPPATAPFWARTSVPLGSGHARPLWQILCDGSCGADDDGRCGSCGLPVVPPGFVGLELHLDLRWTVPVSAMRWNHALHGSYVAADRLDGNKHLRVLGEHGLDWDASDDWPWPLRAGARASIARAVGTDPDLPGLYGPLEGPKWDGTNMIAFWELWVEDVSRVMRPAGA